MFASFNNKKNRSKYWHICICVQMWLNIDIVMTYNYMHARICTCMCVFIRHTLHDGDDGLVSMQNGKHWQFDVIKCPFREKLFNEFNWIENERWISMSKSCVNHNMKTSTCRILKTINGANVENGFSSAKMIYCQVFWHHQQQQQQHEEMRTEDDCTHESIIHG